MAPRKQKSKKERADMRIRAPTSRFYNLAADPTAPRLRGCIYVQTELPQFMLPKAMEKDSFFCFRGSFLTSTHLYAFYTETPNSSLYLARMCLFSQTWQKVPSFWMRPLSDSPFIVVPLHWGDGEGGNRNNHRQEILLLKPNFCHVMTLNPPAGNLSRSGEGEGDPPQTTLVELDLTSMIPFPDDMVVNVVVKVFTNWLQAAVDREGRAVYVLLEIGKGSCLAPKELALYRLDWRTRHWERLVITPTPRAQQLKRGIFLALHNGYLYNGVAHESQMPAIRGGRWSDKQNVSVVEVQRVNLTTLVLDRRFGRRPPKSLTNFQAKLDFVQVGDTVYAMSVLLGTHSAVEARLKKVRNQFWALKLPSLVWSQVNDGPQSERTKPLSLTGDTPATPTLRGSMLMDCFSLAAVPDESELWALSMKHIKPKSLQQLKAFRVPLKEVSSLTSMTLSSLLLRAPMKALVVNISPYTRVKNQLRTRWMSKQERTLPYLRSFVRQTADLQFFAENYLPEKERWQVAEEERGGQE